MRMCNLEKLKELKAGDGKEMCGESFHRAEKLQRQRTKATSKYLASPSLRYAALEDDKASLRHQYEAAIQTEIHLYI